MEFWKIFYIHFIRDPKGITYVAFFLKIESHAKMRLPTFGSHCIIQHLTLYYKLLIKHRDIGILPQSVNCPTCNKKIDKVTIRNRRTYFRCKCGKETTAREGTILKNAKIRLYFFFPPVNILQSSAWHIELMKQQDQKV